MKRMKRATAWMLCLAMLLGPCAAAEDVPEVTEAPVATDAPAPEPTDAPTMEPTPETADTPVPEPTDAPAPESADAPPPVALSAPTAQADTAPEENLTDAPTESPSSDPTTSPSTDPTTSPSDDPTTSPSTDPTTSPSDDPTTSPSSDPTESPSSDPTTGPSNDPTTSPSTDPTTSPSNDPTTSPSSDPTTSPSSDPTTSPSNEPTTSPSSNPTTSPSADPTDTVEPQETPAWEPKGEAWMALEEETGVRNVDGELQAILDELFLNDITTTVYLLTEEKVTVKQIDPEFIRSLTLKPDPETFKDPQMTYAIQMEEGEAAAENEYPPVTIWVEQTEKETPTTEPTESPDPSQTTEPTESPDPTQTTKPTESPDPSQTTEPTESPDPSQTTEPTESPDPTQTVEPTETPAPGIAIAVEARGYRPGEWSNELPEFRLSGIPEGDDAHVYGVFICDEELILFSKGNNVYSPAMEGEISLRFAIFDAMGDLVSLSDQYDMMLDLTPPDVFIAQLDYNDTMAELMLGDGVSGIVSVSVDGGQTWREPEEPMYLAGSVGDIIEEGRVRVRDAAGNEAWNFEQFRFGPEPAPRLPSTGKKSVRHVPETLDYSTANYNALDLDFSDEPVSELWAGDTQLALTLRGETENDTFTAALTTWQSEEDEQEQKPNALVLRAQEQEGVNVWQFTGDVYRLLYNSGVDYLVLQSGDYIAAMPTSGFTGGTAYAKLKASGVSTRKFAYTLCQDESLRETTLSCTVGDETYLMEEDKNQPMYRYDVLVGGSELMDKPYASYLPQNEQMEEQR